MTAQSSKWCGGLLTILLGLSIPGRSAAQEPPQTSAPPPAIRVYTNSVRVGATVTGTNGNIVKGLRPRDFRVFDDGAEQPLTSFLSFEEPARVVLLLECGPMAPFLKKRELETADMLLNSVSPADRVAIVGYSSVPSPVLDFTADKLQARSALHSMSFMSLDELNLSSSVERTLDQLTYVPGKKSVVVISSGVDTTPIAKWQLIQEKIRISDVRVFAVSMAADLERFAKGKLSLDQREDITYIKQVLSGADQSLRQMSEHTGARVYFPRNAKELHHACTEIAQLVGGEYLLEFVPPSLDGRIHSIKVRVNHFWYHVDHRQAYQAPLPPSS
jgi:VWFA-related protein